MSFVMFPSDGSADGRLVIVKPTVQALAAASREPGLSPGPLLSNGSIAVKPDLALEGQEHGAGLSCDGFSIRSHSSTSSSKSSSKSTTKSSSKHIDIDVLQTGVCVLIGDSWTDVPVALEEASLDTTTSLFRASFGSTDQAQSQSQSQSHELRALVNAPSFLLHTVTVTDTVSSVSAVPRALFHRIVARSPRTAFSGGVTEVPGLPGDSAMYWVGAVGECADHADASDYAESADSAHSAESAQVSTACVYIFDPAQLRPLGSSNVSGPGSLSSVSRFEILAPVVTLHVLTGVASEPLETLIGAAADMLTSHTQPLTHNQSNSGSYPSAIQRIVGKHESAWASRWASEISVRPRIGLSAHDSLRARSIESSLRACMHALHSLGPGISLAYRTDSRSHRSNSHNSHISNSHRSDSDIDTFVMPVITLTYPAAAREIMDARIQLLAAARSRAATFGLKGALFEYVPVVPSSARWSQVIRTSQSRYVFYSGLLAVNAWNVFRVTQDHEWLRSRAYELLSAVADMLCSAAVVVADASIDPSMARRSFNSVVALDASVRPAADDAVTVAAARLALRAAVEASYVLDLTPKAAWLALRQGLGVPLDADAVVLPSSSAQASTPVALLQPLFVCGPLLRDAVAGSDAPRGLEHGRVLTANAQHWGAPSRTSAPDHPWNLLVVSTVTALAAQYAVTAAGAASMVNAAVASIERFLELYDRGPWCNSDPVLCAMLVSTFAHGFAGVSIQGGVSDTGIGYDAFGISAAMAAAMPHILERVNATGLGEDGIDSWSVINQEDTLAWIGRGSMVPWSTFALLP
jgi:hypothetical protein